MIFFLGNEIWSQIGERDNAKYKVNANNIATSKFRKNCLELIEYSELLSKYLKQAPWIFEFWLPNDFSKYNHWN